MTDSPTPGDGAPSIVRPIVRPAGQRDDHSDSKGYARLRPWLMGVLLVVLAVVLVGVFVYLPRYAQRAASNTPAVAPAAAAAVASKQATPAPRPLTEADYLKLAAAMDQAEQARGAYDALLASWDARGAAEWATEAFTAARRTGDAAAKQFSARQFTDALKSYKDALTQLQNVTDVGKRLLVQQLARGNEALTAGQSVAARQAYALALRVDPNSVAAARGLKRAGTLDQVVALVNGAANDERAGVLQSATQRYEAALKLDPDTTAARSGLARVQGRISGDHFAASMSQGMQFIKEEKAAQARAAFESAGKLRPGAHEVADGLAQVEQLEKLQQIASHRGKAESSERDEKWGDVVTEYEAALQIDPALEFAKQGRSRALPRLALTKQFEQLAAQPERLWSAGVRSQAHALMTEAQKVATPGPVLRGEMAALASELAQAEAPVQVALESDSATEVAINRVGKLGSFARREMQLLPGNYVVVGTRPGYRDVRQSLTVQPGQSPAPLVVRCEEHI